MAAIKTIAEIGAQYDTDKGWFHRYLEVYDTLLTRHRETARNVLEIGVQRGGSLQLWREVFPDAAIVGIDLDPQCTGVELGEGITVCVGDAYAEPVLSATRREGPFDVIIDDGPHTLESMCFVAEHYSWLLLAGGGTLVIEDIANPEWIGVIADCLPTALRRHAFSIDRRHVPRPGLPGGHADVASILFVVDITS